MELFSAVFFCIAAADYLAGDRLGLGGAFRQGFAAVIELLLLMTGFMALAPWIAVHISPVLSPAFTAVGCDPSLFASILLSCDAGGAVLAEQIALDPQAGLYSGMIVASFLGCTLNGTVPLALGSTQGTKRQAAVNGLLVGFLVLPAACLVTGLCCGMPLPMLLRNTWPVLAAAAVLLLLFRFCTKAVLPVFAGIAVAIRGLALFGFCVSVLQEAAGVVWLDSLTPLDEIFPVICRIAVFLSGILPFFTLVQRLLAKPLAALSARLRLQPQAITALVVTSANCIPTLLHLEDLDSRGITINTAFAVIASYTVGDFLAFCMQFAPYIALPMLAGRLLSGFAALLLAYRLLPVFYPEGAPPP